MRNIDALHPVVQEMVMNHQDAARKIGLGVQCIETWRGEIDQNAAKARGASKAAWGQSWHNVTINGNPASMAYHLALLRPGGLVGFGERLTKPMLLMYRALGLLGETLGLRWGGNWDQDAVALEDGENDLTHFEFHPNGATLSQTIAAIKASGNIFRGA